MGRGIRRHTADQLAEAQDPRTEEGIPVALWLRFCPHHIEEDMSMRAVQPPGTNSMPCVGRGAKKEANVRARLGKENRYEP